MLSMQLRNTMRFIYNSTTFIQFSFEVKNYNAHPDERVRSGSSLFPIVAIGSAVGVRIAFDISIAIGSTVLDYRLLLAVNFICIIGT
jgi:hypothetical protein